MALRPAIVAACLATAVLGAQAPAPSSQSGESGDHGQRATFRTGVDSVRVDLYVLRDGVPVHDLRREEVEVLEDGTPQTIQTFERIAFAAPSADPVVRPQTLDRSRSMAADPRSRVFVVFLEGDPALPLGVRMQERVPWVRIFNGLLGPDDLVAIMTPGMRPSDLTFDRSLPQVEDGWFTDPSDDPKHRLWDSCYPPGPGSPNAAMKARDQERRVFDALEELIVYLGALKEERAHVMVITDGWRLFTEDPSLLAPQGPPRVPGVPIGTPIGGRGDGGIGVVSSDGVVVRTEHVLRECEADLLALSLLDHSRRPNEIAAQAIQRNVSLYPVSLARLNTSTAPRFPPFRPLQMVPEPRYVNTTRLFVQATLRDLADDTGGLAVVNTNNIEHHLQRIATSTSAYYLLSYAPTNRAFDGQYRQITVRVARPGVHVRARPGYVAAAPPEAVPRPVRVATSSPVYVALGRLEAAVRMAARGTLDAAAAEGLATTPSLDEFAFLRSRSAAAAPYTRTTDPRFRRNERLRLEGPRRHAGRVSARLLDRRGNLLAIPVTLTERRDGDADAIGWIVVDVPLGPLAIGDYLIEVREGDATWFVAFRLVS